jgi:hypothetical protein
MNNTTFGLTLLLVGMGGTLLTLWVLTLLLRLIMHLFPAEAAGTKHSTGGHDRA